MKQEIQAKRIMFAACRSHSGKTTVTLAALEALKRRGLHPLSYKCGPDYIDPMFHETVLGISGRNLDTYFAGTDGVREILAGCGDDYAVIEGAMGIYDGARLDGIEGSAYETAQVTMTPVILIVDVTGVGRTVLSMLRGVLLDDTSHLIRGILLNKIGEGYYNRLKPVLEQKLEEWGTGIRLLGYLPKRPELSVESRHLGLKLPGEIESLRAGIKAAAEQMEKSVDMDEMIRIMEAAPSVEIASKSPAELCSGDGLTLAVARDEAFCFYYRDNLELFLKQGVRIRYFSPLTDEEVPEDADGILLGGGYPELYLKELSENGSMLESVRNTIERGIPSLAECGGFMYLHREVRDPEGASYQMAGVIDGACSYTGHLVRFGYMDIRSVEDASGDELYRSLEGMKGHEFHYYDSTSAGTACVAGKPYRPDTWSCIHAEQNGIWGFPHFYYGSDPRFVTAFIRRMKEVADGKLT